MHMIVHVEKYTESNSPLGKKYRIKPEEVYRREEEGGG